MSNQSCLTSKINPLNNQVKQHSLYYITLANIFHLCVSETQDEDKFNFN